ncbi:MAG: EAL domain-containing protein [Epsilonproteobacteria bacterium]|nr:EAL domain-containing protein [Campylobacterota bacterium]
MKFDCEKVLEKISLSVYYLVFDFETQNVIDFKFLQYANYGGYELEKFDKNLLFEKIPPEDIEEDKKKLMELKTKDYVELEHRFYKADGSFVYIRAKINVYKREKNRVYCIGVSEDIEKEKEYEIIVNKLFKSPHIGILIFRENILFMNETLKHLVGCERCEGISLFELLRNVPVDEYKKVIQRRLKGEDIFFYRENIELAQKKRVFINAFVQTIVFEGRYAGLAVVADNTESVKRGIFAKIINTISASLSSYERKREFFDTVYKAVANSGYKCAINYEDIKIGKTEKFNFNDITIFNNGKGLYIPFDKGEIVITSEYIDEFEERFRDEYIKLQHTLEYATASIRRNRLLNILREAIEKSYQWVIITDKNGNIIYANDVVVELSGYSKEEIIGKKPKIFKSGFHNDNFYESLWKTIREKKIFEDVFVEKSKNGDTFYLKLKIVPVEVDDNLYYVALGLDITKEKKLQENLLKDEITNLLNRKGFVLYAKEMLNKDNYILFLIDIRNFKAINQVKGNTYGNFILREFAHLLKFFFYDEDLIARVGADEFAVLMKVQSSINLPKIIENLIKKVKNIEGLSINIGIAAYPKDSNDINELLEKATIALEAAKREGENRYEFYDNQLKEEIQKMLEAKHLVNEALKNDNFEYFFQPYYSIQEGKIVGAESLLRIVKNKTVLTPYYFIDYAEKSGAIREIESIMVKKIKDYLQKIDLPLSFNLSAISIKENEHLAPLFEIESGKITIELTEREVARNIEDTKKLFEIFRNRGFKTAIDDFGTGYSSLTYIKELDIDILKIDMSFIKNITTSKKDLALVKTIITLARTLGFKTIAEGVETKEQFEILKELGCNMIQGYLISPPMPLEEFIKFKNNFKGLVWN